MVLGPVREDNVPLVSTLTLTGQQEGQVLQVGEQEVLAGPQVAHGGPRGVRAGTQLVDDLGETAPGLAGFTYTPTLSS